MPRNGLKVGASEYDLASSSGHSIEAGARILDTYNPGYFKAAKSAQAKRLKARFSGGKKNGRETKKAKKFENPGQKSLKA